MAQCEQYCEDACEKNCMDRCEVGCQDVFERNCSKLYQIHCTSFCERGCESLNERQCNYLIEKSHVIDLPCTEQVKSFQSISPMAYNNVIQTNTLERETSDERFEITDLQYNQVYTFQLKSISENKDEGEWTEAMTFRTEKETSFELPSNINAKVTGSHVTITFTKGQNAYKTAISGDMTTVEKLVPVEGEVFEFNLPKESIDEMYKKEYTFTLQSIAEDGKKSVLTRPYHFENDVNAYLKFGDENYKVGIVQKNLNLIKYYPDKINGKGSIDGKYYDETKKAVKKVQQYIKEKVDSKIVVDGIVYVGIIKQIEDLLISDQYAFRHDCNNDKIRDLQVKLKVLGYFDYGGITDYFGDYTEEAVRQFQSEDETININKNNKEYYEYYKETYSLGVADNFTMEMIDGKYYSLSDECDYCLGCMEPCQIPCQCASQICDASCQICQCLDQQDQSSGNEPIDNIGSIEYIEEINRIVTDTHDKNIFYGETKAAMLGAYAGLSKIINDVNKNREEFDDIDEDSFNRILEIVNDLVIDYGFPSKEVHYFRNVLNRAPKTLDDLLLEKENWTLLPVGQSIYHMYGKNGEYNVKFISSDGHFEAVYDKDENLVTETDNVNMGTYNYSGPIDPIASVLHIHFDWAPYKIWGNVPNGMPIPDEDNKAKYEENQDAQRHRQDVINRLKG